MTASRSTVVVLPGVIAALLSGCVLGTAPSGTGTAEPPAPQSPPAATSGSSEEQIARAIFDRVNAERAARGLEDLAWNEALAGVARSWSVEMAQSGQFEHQEIRQLLQQEELSGFQGLGENIFRATGSVPAGTIHAGWMRSDEHRVNVLDPGWGRVGIGVHCAEDGSVWATQEFGRTVGSDRPPVAGEPPPQEPIARPEDDGPRCG